MWLRLGINYTGRKNSITNHCYARHKTTLVHLQKISSCPQFFFEEARVCAGRSAIVQIANAKPIISTLEAVTPGTKTAVTYGENNGKYLTSNTQIYGEIAVLLRSIDG